MNTRAESHNSYESSERAYQDQKAIREANIRALDGERGRRVQFARLALAMVAILFLALTAAVIAGVRPIIISTLVIFVFSVSFLVRITRQITRIQKLRDQISEAESLARTQREIARQQREGIRARDGRDVIIEPAEWTATNQVRTDWVQGEVGELLPNDIVLKWNHGAWGGLCIERNGKIVANRQLWHIDW